jgi:hypothetical protein
MAFTFPSSPAVNSTYTVGARTYSWTGTFWELQTGTQQIADGAVVTADLANLSVTTEKINDLAVTTAKLNNSSVTTAKLSALSVDTGNIINSSVTSGKLAAGAAVANIGFTPASTVSPTFTGTVVLPTTTTLGNVSQVEHQRLIGVNAPIQEQLNARLTAITANTSNRNLLINGAFDVWQRGTSIPLPLGGGGYVADRWWYYNNGFTSSISRQTCGSTLPQFQYCARIQRTPGQTSTTASVFMSPQETTNSLRFAGKNVTLSFYARASSGLSSATALSAYVNTGTGTDQSNFGAGAYTGLATPIGFTPTLTTSWQRFSATGLIASTSTEIGVQLNFVPAGTAGASDYFEITGMQLEEGIIATPFEFEDIGDTLRKCMRYYQKSFRQDIAPATATGSFDGALQWQGNGGGFGAWCHRSLPVIMRSAPVVTLFNPVSANAQARNTAASVDIQTCTASGYTSAITITASGTGDSASQGSAIHYSLSSEL